MLSGQRQSGISDENRERMLRIQRIDSVSETERLAGTPSKSKRVVTSDVAITGIGVDPLDQMNPFARFVLDAVSFRAEAVGRSRGIETVRHRVPSTGTIEIPRLTSFARNDNPLGMTTRSE